jgi:hypothetical protein
MFGSEMVRCEEAEKLRNKQHHKLYSKANILLNDGVKENGNGRACSMRGKKMNA